MAADEDESWWLQIAQIPEERLLSTAAPAAGAKVAPRRPAGFIPPLRNQPIGDAPQRFDSRQQPVATGAPRRAFSSAAATPAVEPKATLDAANPSFWSSGPAPGASGVHQQRAAKQQWTCGEASGNLSSPESSDGVADADLKSEAASLMRFKAAELKQMCKDRGLFVTGVLAVLAFFCRTPFDVRS